MFVIVHENNVVWGPKPWNKFGFEDVLRTDCEVEYTLSQRNDARSSVGINEKTKILPVIELEKVAINPKIQTYQGPYYNFHEDRAEQHWQVQDLPIDIVKGSLKGIVAANRYLREIAGIKVNVQGNEVSVDTSRDGRQIYFDTYMAMNDQETIVWKFTEMWISLTKADLGAIVSAGKNHIQSAFQWEAEKAAEIDAATTLAELNAIDLGNPPEPESTRGIAVE